MPLPTLPEQPEVDPAGDYARAQAWAMLQARYADAGNYAIWAHNTLQALTDDLKMAVNTDSVGARLDTLLDLASNFDTSGITAYAPPQAPDYDPVGSYTAPDQVTFDSLPAMPDLALPDAPAPSISFNNTAFSDNLISTLRQRLDADLAGVAAAEAAVFARHTGRVTSENSRAYTQVTTLMSSGGWDVPTGALLAKQTELNAEGAKRLTDASADIMTTAAKESMQASLQLLDMLGRLNDSQVMRDFEAAKAAAALSVDIFKASIEGLLGEAQLAKANIDASVAINDGKVKLFLGQVEGQVAPIKAIAESNQAQAQAYSAAVQAAAASVDASSKPAELKIKALSVQGELASKAAGMAIEASMREVAQQVESLRGLSQAAMQMIASAMNSVSSSTSFGFDGKASTSYDGDITEKTAANLAIAQLKQAPGGY